MNDLIYTLFLAIVQGITEWLPVSSSGHLVLFEAIFNYKADLAFDIALHFGTLMAVFVYFGKEITDILRDILSGKWNSENGHMGWLLVVASIPAGLAGYFLYDFFEGVFNSLVITAAGFAVTGMVLLIASLELTSRSDRVKLKNAIIIGFAQVVSILPGISRSGTTLSTGLLTGLSEKSALRFSFLMSIPIIFGANVVSVAKNGLSLSSDYLLGAAVAFVIGLMAIHLLMKVILTSKKNLRWFGIYALALAVSLAGYLVLS